MEAGEEEAVKGCKDNLIFLNLHNAVEQVEKNAYLYSHFL